MKSCLALTIKDKQVDDNDDEYSHYRRISTLFFKTLHFVIKIDAILSVSSQ